LTNVFLNRGRPLEDTSKGKNLLKKRGTKREKEGDSSPQKESERPVGGGLSTEMFPGGGECSQ